MLSDMASTRADVPAVSPKADVQVPIDRDQHDTQGGIRDEGSELIMTSNDMDSLEDEDDNGIIPTSGVKKMSRTDVSGISKKSYTCNQCRYVTDRKNNLKRHVLTMHEECPKTLDCCGMTFTNKASLREHVIRCHRHGYDCAICGRNFCRKALLKRHVAVHSGQKDYRCPHCGYATSHKSNLDRHSKRHLPKDFAKERFGDVILSSDMTQFHIPRESFANSDHLKRKLLSPSGDVADGKAKMTDSPANKSSDVEGNCAKNKHISPHIRESRKGSDEMRSASSQSDGERPNRGERAFSRMSLLKGLRWGQAHNSPYSSFLNLSALSGSKQRTTMRDNPEPGYPFGAPGGATTFPGSMPGYGWNHPQPQSQQASSGRPATEYTSHLVGAPWRGETACFSGSPYGSQTYAHYLPYHSNLVRMDSQYAASPGLGKRAGDMLWSAPTNGHWRNTLSPEKESRSHDGVKAKNGPSLSRDIHRFNPETRRANPETHHLDLETRCLDPKTRSDNPETRRLEPETRRLDPKTRRLDPETRRLDPETRRLDPETWRLDPETRRLDLETRRLDPETRRLDPETRRVNPGPRRLDLETRRLAPETHSMDREKHPMIPGKRPLDTDTRLMGPDKHRLDVTGAHRWTQSTDRASRKHVSAIPEKISAQFGQAPGVNGDSRGHAHSLPSAREAEDSANSRSRDNNRSTLHQTKHTPTNFSIESLTCKPFKSRENQRECAAPNVTLRDPFSMRSFYPVCPLPKMRLFPGLHHCEKCAITFDNQLELNRHLDIRHRDDIIKLPQRPLTVAFGVRTVPVTLLCHCY